MGKRAGTDTLAETLDCFDPGVPLGTTEVAEQLDLGRRATYERLERLVEQDRLETKAIGANARVWWRSPTGTVDGERGSERDHFYAQIDEAVLALDEECRITYLNERAAELLDVTASATLQSRFLDVLPDLTGAADQCRLEEAATAHEHVEVDGYAAALDRWLEVRGYPSESGLSVYVHDVTERKERDRKLEEARQRYRTLVEHIPNGAVALVDENLRYRTVGGTPIGSVDLATEDIEGKRIGTVLSPELCSVLRPKYKAAIAGEASQFEANVGDRCYQFHVVPVRDDDGAVFAAMGMSQDVTGRKQRERELQRYETIVDTVDDGIFVLDEDGCFLEVNDAYVELTGYEREDLLGTPGSRVVSDAVAADFVDRLRGLEEGDTGSTVVEANVHCADGSRIPTQTRFSAIDTDREREATTAGITRDVSDRVKREGELRDRITQQRTVTDLGQRALEADSLDGLLESLVEQVTETLDADYGKILELDPEHDELSIREGIGWDPGLVGDGTISAVDDESQAVYTLGTDQPVVVEDLTTEWRFSGPELLRAHDVRSGITTVVGSSDEPWGVLGVHTTDPDDFTIQDATFLRAVANVVAAVIERHRHERELIRQREELEALNSLGDVVRDVTAAVIDQSTRPEIERTVCDRLTATESYRYAWIGDLDTATGSVDVRCRPDVDGSPEVGTIGVGPADEREGPTARALRAEAVQIQTDHVDGGGARATDDPPSRVAIPIVHADTVYGALTVSADRSDAFADREREMLTQLGSIVGHAIAAAERKQALMSDELVEIDIRVQDVFGTVDVPETAGGSLTLEETVPVEDGDYLAYGSASPEALEGVRELVEECRHWEHLTVHSEDTPRRFELRMSDPPVISAVAARGGYVDQAVLDGGTLEMTIHLAPTVDVRQVMDVVEETYPDVEMIRRRQITRERDDPNQFRARLVGALTDKQRTALVAAYHAGFFEWPRDATGEAIAESIGVSAPTFHQHLRTVERKVFDQMISSPQ